MLEILLANRLRTRRRAFSLLAFSLLILLGLVSEAKAGAPVKPAAVAGSWYPEDAGELDALLERLLLSAPQSGGDAAEGAVRVIISPHAGYRHSGAIAAAGFSAVQHRQVRRVIVLGPAHYGDFEGLSIPTVNAYRTPLGVIELDTDAAAQLRRHALVGEHPAAHAREHSIELQLPFLQKVLAPGWKLLPVLVGRMNDGDYPRAADLLRALADERTLVVVSTDFTHYGPAFEYAPFPAFGRPVGHIRELDMGAYRQIAALSYRGFLDYRRDTGITICGYRPLAILLAMLPESATLTLRGYAIGHNSAARAVHSVSYLSAIVRAPSSLAEAFHSRDAEGGWISRAGLESLHEMASRAVEQAVLPSAVNSAALHSLTGNLPAEVRQPFGLFVTLWRRGELHGCRGHVANGQPLFRLAIRNGFNAAALYDRRSSPLHAEELPQLDIEISVLSPLQHIQSLQEWVNGQHGLYLSANGRHALYLPQVSTLAGWDTEQTLSHLCDKAGLTPASCNLQDAKLEIFTTQTYRAPFVGR